MRMEIRITGSGGQGAITVGHILGRAAAIHDGKEAVVTEGYSPYITGGWSRADVVISDSPIDYPLVSRLDCLLTMYQEGLDQNARLVKPSGAIIAESKLVDVSHIRSDARIFSVPAAAASQTLGRKVLMNVIMLGSLLAATPAVSRASVERTLAERFPKAVELNMKPVLGILSPCRGLMEYHHVGVFRTKKPLQGRRSNSDGVCQQ